MRIISKPRGGGKTTEIAEWVKQGRINNIKGSGKRVIVVRSRVKKDQVMSSFGLDRSEVMSYGSASHEAYRQQIGSKELFLDNADEFMQRQFHGRLEGASFTDNYPKLPPNSHDQMSASRSIDFGSSTFDPGKTSKVPPTDYQLTKEVK